MFYVPKPNEGTLQKGKNNSCDSLLMNDSSDHDDVTQVRKPQPYCLNVTVKAGRNLSVMDMNGKSDPYCIVSVGEDEAKTTVQYGTVDPKWDAKFTFSIYNGPHFKSPVHEADSKGDSDQNRRIVNYVIVDVWDKDTLNRDDFMGRVMVPVAFLSNDPLSGWFTLGKTSARDPDLGGEIYLELHIDSCMPITRWVIDDQLHKRCAEIPGFELPIQGSNSVVHYPGETERVEMVFKNVVVEVSKHRDVATVYLTDYRLLIICKPNERNAEDHSMWIPFKNIRSVEKAENEKAVRRSLSGIRRTSIVKCLTVRCCDFKSIRLTFMDSKHSSQLFTNYTENFKEVFLPPTFNAKQGEYPSPSVLPDIEVVQGEDDDVNDAASDSWSLCEDDDDVEEGEEFDINALEQCNQLYGSSPNLLKEPTPSPPNRCYDVGRIFQLWNSVQRTVTPSSSPIDRPPTSAGPKFYVNNEVEPSNEFSFCVEYVNIFCVRLTFFMLNMAEAPLSKEFVRSYPESISLRWNIYDVEEEFRRQKVDNNWRLSEVNVEYAVSHSYPKNIYVPSSVEDGILRKCATFRSKGRLPVLCWFNAKKGNFIMRCAQPRTGPRKKFCVQDEYVVRTAMASNPYSRKMVIFDARSLIAASGNQLKGKGTEDVERYSGCKLTFLNIPNIHAVRESLEKLCIACEMSSQRKWFTQLEASQWLAYISLILKGAISIVSHVDVKGVAALIHCSDGWDRTAQLSALAQILLDPYYRTIKGFQVLVEKEWISFGHRFRDRNCHPSTNSNQRSPIFQQFLDCVWQILMQFPQSFEFTSDYLLRIVDHVNSGWFGTFMCNNEREREDKDIARCTVSLWAHLDSIQDVFRNGSFVHTDEVLHPTSSLRRLRLWTDYYLRYDETFWSSSSSFFDFGQPNDDESTDAPRSHGTVIWVANERVKECHDCKVKFSHFNRRHHCRACGQIFCNECSCHRVYLWALGYTKQERVCDRCFIKYKDETNQANEASNSDLASFEVL